MKYEQFEIYFDKLLRAFGNPRIAAEKLERYYEKTVGCSEEQLKITIDRIIDQHRMFPTPSEFLAAMSSLGFSFKAEQILQEEMVYKSLPRRFSEDDLRNTSLCNLLYEKWDDKVDYYLNMFNKRKVGEISSNKFKSFEDAFFFRLDQIKQEKGYSKLGDHWVRA